MTKLRQHIEDMRARLSEIATGEKVLIRALADALDRLDAQLLRDVRQVASDHEARREAILGELQGLAAGIGMFRPPLASRAREERLPSYMPADGPRQAIAPGDWREATRNIEDEFEVDHGGSAPRH